MGFIDHNLILSLEPFDQHLELQCILSAEISLPKMLSKRACWSNSLGSSSIQRGDLLQ